MSEQFVLNSQFDIMTQHTIPLNCENISNLEKIKDSHLYKKYNICFGLKIYHNHAFYKLPVQSFH